MKTLLHKYPLPSPAQAGDSILIISLSAQTLGLFRAGSLEHLYEISSGKAGAGEERDSEKTPRGWHVIRAKIGQGAPVNTVFVGRRPTGEMYSPELGNQHPNRDWILSRILWLSGLEVGKNRLGLVDTMQRYIYLHGTPDSTPLRKPGSRGCIRMRNADIVTVFDQVPNGTKVFISED